MITYEDIEKANKAIVAQQIKDKAYAEVNQRIKAFRMCYPNGVITTDIISLKDGVVLMKAQAINEESVVIGTGYAQEKETASFINKTSYIENCETSAVGRALGMCGFGIEKSLASYEEVMNAIENQKEDEKEEAKITPKQLQILEKCYYGDNLTKLLEANNIEKLEDLPKSKASELISKIYAKKDEKNV